MRALNILWVFIALMFFFPGRVFSADCIYLVDSSNGTFWDSCYDPGYSINAIDSFFLDPQSGSLVTHTVSSSQFCNESSSASIIYFNSVSGSWVQNTYNFGSFVNPFSGYTGTLPYGTTTAQMSIDYPDGCGSPTCDDTEKLCEQLRLVDDNNIIKFASYVTYEHRDSPFETTSSLEYRSPDFNPESDYTAYSSIGSPDCFCPSDDKLPSDLQNNFTVVPPGQQVADLSARDPFFCAEKCFPRGYMYTDGNCICIDDGANIDPAKTPPGVPTPETSANVPADPTDSAQQLGAVNENLGSIINQGNQTNGYLSNIADNIANSVGNQQGIVDGISSLGNRLGSDLSGLGDKLDAISNQQDHVYNLEGSADLPTDNVYDIELDTIEEDSLLDAITEYISSGIPVLSYINGSGVTISNASSSVSTNLWGSTVTFDLSPMADILNTMGYFLTGIFTIVAFFIIVRRG